MRKAIPLHRKGAKRTATAASKRKKRSLRRPKKRKIKKGLKGQRSLRIRLKLTVKLKLRRKQKLRIKRRLTIRRRLRLKRKRVSPIIHSDPAPIQQAVISNETLPIIFIHRGSDEYLSSSLQQAKRSNPGSNIILIGDSANGNYASDSVQHFMIDDYYQSSQQFAQVYKHLSPNSYEYELFCFQRWFVLKDFVKANNLDRCCYLDSDVMLYTDMSKQEYQQFTNVWVMLTLNTKQTLEDFCYLIDIYFRNPDLFEYLKAYSERLGYHGLNDMVFQSLFLDHWPQYKHNLDGVFQESFFDGNISHPLHIPSMVGDNGLVEMLDGRKKVYRIKGTLYARTESGRWIIINSLHFQAESKKYMFFFLAPDLHAEDEQIYYFDYRSNQWLAVVE